MNSFRKNSTNKYTKKTVKAFNPSDYEIVKELGKGGFGSVYEVREKINNINFNKIKKYAMKEILLANESKEAIEEAKKEAEFLSKFDNNQFIIKYYGSTIYNNKFYILMELFNGKNLRQFLNEKKGNKELIEKGIIIKIIEQICLGIRVIHNKNIVHRDLKPENIFIDVNNKIKIGDFGLSRNFNSYKAYTLTPNGAGTIPYNAPEVLNEGKYNKKSDIYSLGCIIYELFTLNFYFSDKLCDRIKIIDNGKYQKLVNSLLQIDFNKRPDINQIINDYVDEGKINNIIINNNDINYYNESNYYFNNNINYKNNKNYISDNGCTYFLKNHPTGIKSIKNYSYFISGLQIIASCEIIKKILNYRYNENKFIYLLNDTFEKLNHNHSSPLLDCSNLWEYLIQNGILNSNNKEGDSQAFIEILIKNINEAVDMDFLSIFSFRTEILGQCYNCKKEINKKDDISSDITKKIKFNNTRKYIDIIEHKLLSRNEILCPYCYNKIVEYKKKVKLPEILIFTIEKNEFIKFFVENEIKIQGERYQLFAINIKLEKNPETIHYICQVEMEGRWYEINNEYIRSIIRPGEEYNDRICGIFYKKI